MSLNDRLRVVEMQITTHEAVCAERYAAILHTAETMRQNLSATNKLITKVGLAVLAGMAGVLTKLVFFA